jgi:hypothetical protein
MGNYVAGIFCTLRLNLGICQEIQTKTADNFSLRIEIRSVELLGSKHKRSPLDDKILRSSYGLQCFNFSFNGQ